MEESGYIVVRTNAKLQESIQSKDFNQLLTNLLQQAGFTEPNFFKKDAYIDNAELKNGYVFISYDCSEWADLAEKIVKRGSVFGFYSQHHDEYGVHSYFALTEVGEVHMVRVDSESDMIDNMEYQESIIQGLKKWTELLPVSLKNAFPDFATVKIEDYFDTIELVKDDFESTSKPVTFKQFVGEGRGRSNPDDVYETTRFSINAIKNDDITSFKSALKEVAGLFSGYVILNDIVGFLVSQKEARGLKDPKKYFEALLKQFPEYFLNEVFFPRVLSSTSFSEKDSPLGHMFASMLLDEVSFKPSIASLKDALLIAASSNAVDLIDRMLKLVKESVFKNRNKDTKDILFSTTHSAAYRGSYDVLEYLLRISKANGPELFSAAAHGGDYEIVRLLIDKKVKLNPPGYQLFEYALESGDSKLVKALLDYGMEVPEAGHKLSRPLQALVASTTTNNHKPIESKEIYDLLEDHSPGFWAATEENDKERIIRAAVHFGGGAWVLKYSDEEHEQKIGRSRLALVHHLLDEYLSSIQNKDISENEFLRGLIVVACKQTMPFVLEKLLAVGVDKDSRDDKGQSLEDIAMAEARIYILGSRKGGPDIFKLNALKILLLLGADISDFPDDLVARSKAFKYEL